MSLNVFGIAIINKGQYLKKKGWGVFGISCFALYSTVPYCDSGGRGGAMGVCLGVCM